jgi:hypothetical protein
MHGSTLNTALATLFLVASPGCSLILTKGPEPEVHPPPECTTSVAAPVTDTILAATSVALAIAGLAAASSSCPSTGQFGNCGLGQGSGEIVGIGGAALGVLFGVSAGLGYARTSACRTSLAPGYLPPPTQLAPAPETALWPMLPSPGCLPTGDAPRLCALKAPTEVSWAVGDSGPR